jgi:hypothetical protein
MINQIDGLDRLPRGQTFEHTLGELVGVPHDL